MQKKPSEKYRVCRSWVFILGLGIILMFTWCVYALCDRNGIASEGLTESIVIEQITEMEHTESTACMTSELELIAEQIGLFVDEVEMDLPDVENEYELLFVSDMHILHVDEHVVENIETAQVREKIMFRTENGMASKDTWLLLSSVIDDFEADGLILGGDMMDFISPSNIQVLSDGLEQIETPYMYLMADHDHGIWYSGGNIDQNQAITYQKNISAYEDMFILEYPEFYILGWNNSTSQLTGEGLEAAKSIWDNGKPILLATHVPINSIVDDALAVAASEADPKNRIKLWGIGCLYWPNENTIEFLNMVCDEQSPVEAVFSGHLHFKYEVQLTEQIKEYVFAPAFEGKIAKIVIK